MHVLTLATSIVVAFCLATSDASTAAVESDEVSANRTTFCVLELNENMTTSWCKMQCADSDGVLYAFNLRDFSEHNFADFYGDDGTHYKWSPCSPLNQEGSPACSADTDSPAMCKEDVANQWESIGQLPPATIYLHTTNKEDGLAYSYIYNDSIVESQIDFYCKNGETPGLINEDSDKVIPQTHYHFIVESSYACPIAVTPTRPTTPPPQPQGSDNPLSPGAIVAIALVGCFLIYFVAGMAFKRVSQGARGFEVIPNISFWSHLWCSVKLGALWIVSPCYKGKSTSKLRYQKV